MRFEEITTQEALDTIIRAAMKRTYDKGDHVSNARAFADTVTRQHLDNEAAIPGSLRIAYQAALKTLAEGEATRVNPEAYSAWTPPEDDYQPCTPEERARWLAIIQTKLARLDLGMNRPTLAAVPPLEDDDIPGYGDAA
jgi:hypothetical protein